VRAEGGPTARLGLVAVGIAVAGDVLETATQLHITGSLPGTATSLTLLAAGSAGKFLGLALVCACAGGAMFSRGRSVGRVAGVACLLGGLLVVVGWAHPPARAALSAGNAIAWTVMLLYAIAAAVRTAR
jgi:hypothetical protein